MSQQNESGILSVVAGAARAAFLRVYDNAGTWTTAGATNQADGVQQIPSLAATDIVPIKITNAQGTRKMVADGAISAGAAVYAGATGYVSAAGTVIEGRALEAATAVDQVIEVLPLHNADVPSTAGVATPTVTFNGLTGANEIRVPTNLADALSVEDTAGDLIVFTTTTGSQAIAVTPATSFAAAVTHSADAIIVTGVDLALGTTSDALLRFSAADASDPALVLALDDTSQQMHITDKAAVATDWNRSAGTHPEVSIHSNTTPATDYMAIGNHDGTTCYIDNVGGTTVSVKIAGTQCAAFTAGGVAASALTLTGGITGPTSTLAPMIPIGADAAAVAPEAAIPLTNYLSWLDATAGATTQTLADGVVRGQVKRLQAVHANNDVVTVDNMTGGTTITFTNVGEYVVLLWTGAAWVIIESGNVLLGTNVGPAVA